MVFEYYMYTKNYPILSRSGVMPILNLERMTLLLKGLF